MEKATKRTISFVTAFIVLIAALLVLGTLWMGSSSNDAADRAVREVSLLYLEELADRRKQVVENNLNNNISTIRAAIDMLTAEDLSDIVHLQAYQVRMKKLYNLEKFAFVDTDGLIYTSLGYKYNIDDYSFDHLTISEPEISILNLHAPDKKVVIAVPIDVPYKEKTLCVCFMEIDMKVMLSGAAIDSSVNGATFCNIYTEDGIALTNTVLGGLSSDDNLLTAMKIAEFDEGYSYDGFLDEFGHGADSEVSFTYKDIRETLSFVHIKNTDWLLTYLIRESVLAEKISYISDELVRKSIIQSVIIIVAVLGMFSYLLIHSKRNARLKLQSQTAEAELKGKQAELEHRIRLQKKLEDQSTLLAEALTAAESANKAKTAFLSNMSHEIRTPMNAIIGLDAIAMRDPDTSPKTRTYLEKIDASAKHLLGLINDILDMSRIESGRMTIKDEEFSFREFIDQVNVIINSQCIDKGLTYECHVVGHTNDYYVGDAMKLKQVLINILGNSVKFTDAPGTVNLTVEHLKTDPYTGLAAMRFVMRDTGVGMDKEFLPKIFEAFAQEDVSTTNRYGGSGLGMAITKTYVEMMNGTIEVESEKGVGSVFTVTVTLRTSSRTYAADADFTLPSHMRCAVVDDDDVACDHAQLVLKSMGIESDQFSCADEAISAVHRAYEEGKPYDIIITDYRMPEKDGLELTREIRRFDHGRTAVIILTAYNWDIAEEVAREGGVDSIIPKPLFAESLAHAVNAALMAKSGETADGSDAPVFIDAGLAGLRVLMAEDVDANADILADLLELEEVESERAVNGKIAVEMFTSKPAGYYDAILMDVRMPVMDGLTATKTIRALDRPDAKTVPILAMTANVFDEDVERSLRAGMDAHLSKPVEPEKLYEALRKYTRKDTDNG